MRAPTTVGSLSFLSLLVGLAPACGQPAQQPPAPAPMYAGPPMGAACADGPAMCGADRASVVQCRRGAWVTLQPCFGPQGCSIAGNAIQCDSSLSRPGDPCAPEGGYACTPDRRALTVCRGGRAAMASTCRGARGCVVGQAVDCDHSLAAINDPCDGPKEIACSLDNKQLLRCSGGFYQVGESCRNACLATAGRVLCQ